MEEVRGYVDFVVFGEEDAGFVEEWIVGCAVGGEKERMGWSVSEELAEGWVVLQDS